MAQETLKELKYDGKKVIAEVARRDALGRTIDTTYATKSEISTGDSVIDLTAYPLKTTTNIPVSVLQPLIDKLTANEPPTILFSLEESRLFTAKNYMYNNSIIAVSFPMGGLYDYAEDLKAKAVSLYSIQIDLTTGNITKSLAGSDSEDTFPMEGYLLDDNFIGILYWLNKDGRWMFLTRTNAENAFTEVNTFGKGIKIGSTTLNETVLTNLINGTPTNAKQLTTQNLDDYKTQSQCGWYYAASGNTVTNKPSNVDAFGLELLRTASGYYIQILYPANNSINTMWMRTWQSSSWTSWVEKGKNGAAGTDGQDGVTPNIAATATVDNNTGTPSVEVVKGGTNEAPTFAFNFKNLKGDKGASGDIKGVVNNVSDLPSGGDEKNYIVTANGHWYYWRDNVWNDGGVYQATEIENDSITPAKTSFIETNSTIERGNILDNDLMIWDNQYVDSSGNLATYIGYGHSPLIPVNRRLNFQVNFRGIVSYYNAWQQFMTQQPVDANVVYTDMPAECCYINVSIDSVTSTTTKGNYMVWIGGNMPNQFVAPFHKLNENIQINEYKEEIALNQMTNAYFQKNGEHGCKISAADPNWRISSGVWLEAGDYIEYISDGWINDGVTLIATKGITLDQYVTVVNTAGTTENYDNHTFLRIEASGYYYFCDKAGIGKSWRLFKYPLKKTKGISKYIDLSLFQSIGIIGDSYASGELQKVDSEGNRTGWKDLFDISWGQIMGRNCGVEVTNYSVGGIQFGNWIYNGNCGVKFENDINSGNAKELYVCALGLNEVWNEIGTPNDEAGANTVYGHIKQFMAFVMPKIRANNSKLIMSTIMPNQVTNTNFPVDKVKQINEAIKYCSAENLVPVIEQKQNEYFKSDYYCNYMTYAHPNAASCAGMAGAYEDMIKECSVYHKYDYFSDLFVYRVDE